MEVAIPLLSKTYERELNGKRIELLYLLSAIYFVAALLIFQKPSNTYISILFLSLLLVPIFLYYRNHIIQKNLSKQICGSINWANTLKIDLIKREPIFDENIKEIRLNYEGYLGEGFILKNFIYPKQQNHSFGTGNSIVIITNTEIIHQYCFLIKRADKLDFYKISKHAMMKGINVVETTKGQKTYGGRKLRYKEIQELKNRIAENKKANL